MPKTTLILFLAALFILSACYEPKEGCLDVTATNFDPGADEDCCCLYPQLKFRVFQKFGTRTWVPGDTVQTPAGEWFRLHGAAFYLSGIQLRQGAAAFQATDTVHLRVFAAGGGDTLSKTFLKDVLLVHPPVGTVDFTIGTFSTLGTFDQLVFRVGLPDSVQRVVPSSARAGHPLALQSDSLWLGPDLGYLDGQLIFSRDSAAATVPDTLRFLPGELQLPLMFTGQVTRGIGQDLLFVLEVDYRRLFEGIDLSTGDPAAWKQQIAENLPFAFTISQ
jgi:hypothetical protein